MIHAADLPQGKGWAPLTWQVLEGKNDIVFTLFEADASTDNGPFYLKKTLHLSGYELAPELRALQAQFCISMCKEYHRVAVSRFTASVLPLIARLT